MSPKMPSVSTIGVGCHVVVGQFEGHAIHVGVAQRHSPGVGHPLGGRPPQAAGGHQVGLVHRHDARRQASVHHVARDLGQLGDLLGGQHHLIAGGVRPVALGAGVRRAVGPAQQVPQHDQRPPPVRVAVGRPAVDPDDGADAYSQVVALAQADDRVLWAGSRPATRPGCSPAAPKNMASQSSQAASVSARATLCPAPRTPRPPPARGRSTRCAPHPRGPPAARPVRPPLRPRPRRPAVPRCVERGWRCSRQHRPRTLRHTSGRHLAPAVVAHASIASARGPGDHLQPGVSQDRVEPLDPGPDPRRDGRVVPMAEVAAEHEQFVRVGRPRGLRCGARPRWPGCRPVLRSPGARPKTGTAPGAHRASPGSPAPDD